MKIEIELPEKKASSLSVQGKAMLTKVGLNYLNEILDESERLAITRNTSQTDAEITASIVTDAEVYQRKYKIGKRPKKLIIFIQLSAFVSSIVTGGLFDTTKFNDVLYFIIFLVFFSIALSAAIFSIALGVKND